MKKDIRLTSFFSIVTIPVLILAIILLVFVYRLVVLETLERQVEQNNITVARSLSNAVWEQIKVLELSPQSKESWAFNSIYIDVIGSDIHRFLHGTSVLKVKVYSPEGKTIYSTNPEEIGEMKPEAYPGRIAAMSGEPVSSFSNRDTFHSMEGKLSGVEVLSTYIPKYFEGMYVDNHSPNKVEAVIEVYADITGPMQKIEKNLLNFSAILIFVFTAVFLALYAIVKHADKIISHNKNDLKKKIDDIENMNYILQSKSRELAVARDVANHANVAKSQFLANMSHELRTPLNAILGYTELIREESEQYKNQEMDDDLAKVYQAGSHLLELIDSILDLSKIEAGRMELHREPFVVADLIKEVADTVTPIMKKNNNNVKLDLEIDDMVMFGDITKIRQILFNLVSNAAKFTSNGTITLASRMLKVNNDRKIVFEVSDTGIGIAPENMDKLFDPFEQEDISTTRKYGGTGLGLTITKRFCTMMEGEIEVDSEQGKGTKFIIYLPFVEAPTMTREAV